MALIGTGISYILLGTAESILFLSLARVPSGKFCLFISECLPRLAFFIALINFYQ